MDANHLHANYHIDAAVSVLVMALTQNAAETTPLKAATVRQAIDALGKALGHLEATYTLDDTQPMPAVVWPEGE